MTRSKTAPPRAVPPEGVAPASASPKGISTEAESLLRQTAVNAPEPPEVEDLEGAGGLSDRYMRWGMGFVVAALPVAGIALSWAGREAFVSIATAAMLGLVLLVVNQGRILRQRHGLFLVFSVSGLLVFSVPVGVKLFLGSSEWLRLLVEFSRVQSEKEREGRLASEGASEQPPRPVPLPSTGDRSLKLSASNAVTAVNSANSGTSTTSSVAPVFKPAEAVEVVSGSGFVSPAPSGGASDSSAVSGRKNPGPSAVVGSAKGGGGPSGSAAESRPDEDPVQRATRQAQEEAIRRYPALSVAGSPEHAQYLEAYNELARLRKFEFFKDPQWPLKIADLVAARDGWKRAPEPDPLAFSSPSDRGQENGFETTKDGGATSGSGLANLDSPGTGSPSASPSNVGRASEQKVRAVSEKKTAAQSASAGGTLNPLEEPTLDGPDSSVPSDPVTQSTNRAIIEVRRRYPALGVDGSPENRVYLEAYRELERLRPDFFEKPDWPIRLAEIVAKREGWRRQESGSATAETASGSVEPPLPR